MLYKIEFKKNETKEAQAKSPWGIIKVPWGSKIYITHGILAKEVKVPVMGY